MDPHEFGLSAKMPTRCLPTNAEATVARLKRASAMPATRPMRPETETIVEVSSVYTAAAEVEEILTLDRSDYLY